MAEGGYEIQSVSEVNQVLSFMIPAAAVDSGLDTRCYEAEFRQIDMIWQVSRQDTSPEAVKFHDCLIEAGVTPDSDYDGMVKQLQDLGIDPGSCL